MNLSGKGEEWAAAGPSPEARAEGLSDKTSLCFSWGVTDGGVVGGESWQQTGYS